MENYYFKERFSRFAIFWYMFWFGILKVLGLSQLAPWFWRFLPKRYLLSHRILSNFIGSFEMLVGLLFLFPKFTKVALVLIALHFITIISPLVLLPDMTWQRFLVPTLAGQ
jgi:uncharacterized membrane protein YkgB